MFIETRSGDLEQRGQPAWILAIDNVCCRAGLDCEADRVRLGIAREHEHRGGSPFRDRTHLMQDTPVNHVTDEHDRIRTQRFCIPGGLIIGPDQFQQTVTRIACGFDDLLRSID